MAEKTRQPESTCGKATMGGRRGRGHHCCCPRRCRCCCFPRRRRCCCPHRHCCCCPRRRCCCCPHRHCCCCPCRRWSWSWSWSWSVAAAVSRWSSLVVVGQRRGRWSV